VNSGPPESPLQVFESSPAGPIGGAKFQQIEVDQVRTATGERTLVLDARPLTFPGHTERRVLVTFQDITAHKKS